MAIIVKWGFTIGIEGESPVTIEDKFEVTAYDNLRITVPSEHSNNSKGTIVNLQPSPINDILLLYIKSDHYSQGSSNKLVYFVPQNGTVREINLESAHVLLGNSLVKLLGDNLTQLKFVNNTDKDAQIEIIVGRNA